MFGANVGIKAKVTTKIDHRGRVNIPSQIRRMLKLKTDQELQLTVDGDERIILDKNLED